MARSLAAADAPQGVPVNTLVPGPIETRLRDLLPGKAKHGFEAGVLAQAQLGGVGHPGEAAAVSLFLLSDDPSS